MQELITIKSDLLEVILSPVTGGSIYSFKYCHNGSWIDILKPTTCEAAETRNASKFSSFNLIPYSSILEDGMLDFQGRKYKLYTGSRSEHRSHGEMRRKQCKVLSSTVSKLILSYDSRDYSDVLWPFPFIAIVEYIIDSNKFIMNMKLCNAGQSDMPGGLGIHPYFVRDLAGTKQDIIVKIPMKGVYPGEDQLHSGPWEIQPECDEFTAGKILTGDHLDKCYRVLGGPSFIKWVTTGLKLTYNSSSLFSHMVVYCPPDNNSCFAVEPVSHCNNAFNMHAKGIKDTGTIIIKQGAEISGSVEIEINME